MPDIEIKLDTTELTEKIIKGLASSVVEKMVRDILLFRRVEPRNLEYAFDEAIKQVAKEYYIEQLKQDDKFKDEMRKELSKALSDKVQKKIINELLGRYM